MSTNERPWLSSYPSGISPEVETGRYTSIIAMFDEAIERYRDNVAFVCMGRELSYGEIDRLSRRFASYLLEHLHLKKGDRVALMLPNVLQYPIAIFGVLRAGLTVVNTNPMYTPRELRHQLEDSGAVAIVVLDNFAHTVEQVLADTAVRTVITTGLGDLLGFPKSFITNFVVKYVRKLVPDYSIPDAVGFNAVLAAGGAPLPEVLLDHDDIAFLQYTGGTTGVAKGAMLTHGNLVANMLQASTWIGRNCEDGKETIITALPLYHIFALTANCLVFLQLGGRNHLIVNPRDMPGFVKELATSGFTAITGVNTLFNGLLNTPGFADIDFSRMHLALGGGMAVQRAVAERWKEATGTTLVEAYGLTETSPAACMNPLDLAEYNGSIGLPLPSTEVAIRNEDLKDVAPGEVGELCIRGPQVMKGYWRKSEETAQVLSDDGWLRTGDMARMDEAGFVYIVDRKKDMILVSGFNVYPNEIEDVVAAMPGIREVAAVGLPDEKSGEIIKLVVVRKDPNLTADAIKAYCRERLTGYKNPKIIEFRDELPKSNVGKILRRELRDAAPVVSAPTDVH